MRSGLRVLVVDDDDDTRNCVVGLLVDEGYDVRGSSGGRDALAVLRGGYDPDLVLLDLMMPDMSGWELLDELAKEPELAALPIVLFTAAGDPVLSGVKLTKPMVRKPIDVDLLLEMVRTYCDAARLADEPPSDLLPRVMLPS